MLALRLKCEDGKDVCDVSKTSKDEEEHAQPFGRLSTVVENELGDSRGYVKESTQVAKELAPRTECKGVLSAGQGFLLAASGLFGQEPAYSSSDADHEDYGSIPDHSLQLAGWW